MEDEAKAAVGVRNAPAILRDVDRISDKSIACTLLEAHTACDYLRRGIVEHTHERHKVSNLTGRAVYYMIQAYECPTCSCRCDCHTPEARNAH